MEAGWPGTVEDHKEYTFNLDEYLVTLEKPIGIRFAQREDGKVYVEVRLRRSSFFPLIRSDSSYDVLRVPLSSLLH